MAIDFTWAEIAPAKLKPIERHRGAYIRWTPEMDAMLKKMRTAGCGRVEIAEVIGVCETTVRRRMVELRMPMRLVWSRHTKPFIRHSHLPAQYDRM